MPKSCTVAFGGSNRGGAPYDCRLGESRACSLNGHGQLDGGQLLLFEPWRLKPPAIESSRHCGTCLRMPQSMTPSNASSSLQRSTPGWRSSTRARAFRTMRSSGASAGDPDPLVAAGTSRSRLDSRVCRSGLRPLCGPGRPADARIGRATERVSRIRPSRPRAQRSQPS